MMFFGFSTASERWGSRWALENSDLQATDRGGIG